MVCVGGVWGGWGLASEGRIVQVQAAVGVDQAVAAQVFPLPHLQRAVAATGFDRRTTDHRPPGQDNRGAYWEAGFAEGIGRPVIYTCRQDVRTSTDKDTRPHFDAAHQAIVAWDPADPAPGLAELKAMIHATLPAEARTDGRRQLSWPRVASRRNVTRRVRHRAAWLSARRVGALQLSSAPR